MKKSFEEQLRESLYVHMPLPVDESKTVGFRAARKKPVCSVAAWNGQDLNGWRFDGDGGHSVKDGGVLELHTLSVSERWPETEARMVDAKRGDYATFGSYVARLDTKGMELSRCNRICFEIRPQCDGLHSPIVRAGFVNNGEVKIPDQYSREGFNAINLKNHEWNECFWEIGSIAHDKIEEISFEIHRYGKELSAGDSLCFEIRNIRLDAVKDPENVFGWTLAEEQVVFSTSGYFTGGGKTAVVNTAQTAFEIIGQGGNTAYAGTVEAAQTGIGTFQVMDFSELRKPGLYRIRFGDTVTEEFEIGDRVFLPAIWRICNFFFCERCGYPVPNKHGVCHADITARHNGLDMIYNGGWHDAADVSQQTVQTAEIVHALIETARAVELTEPMLYLRLMEEANWGLDFVLRTRFGDGCRASGAAIRRWSDGLLGNMDDCECRVQNHSFDNFIIAGVEAECAAAFGGADPELAWKCLKTAGEDFMFAHERFAEVGLEPPYFREHSTSASESQYYAAAAWAAAKLYTASKDPVYKGYAESYAGRLLACQETGGAGLPVSGFFYRKEDKKIIVHFAHQSREQIFAQALAACCESIPESPNRPAWEGAMALYGKYLKYLMQYSAPYGMVPAGVFCMDEAEDAETFEYIHPRLDFTREKVSYLAQLENGARIADNYVVKRFPVWFSFRGNSVIHLSMGKAASILGRYFADTELMEIAREQLYWTVGKNPSGQSLIYGEGSNYGSQYTALLGETAGEMPVGIQTRGDGDEPYWPQANIATYREVWTTPSARWLWIIADLISG